MNNELQIKPLMRYDVAFRDYDDTLTLDQFTAESYETTDHGVRFLRTGHVIREYFRMPFSIIVTPAEHEG